MTQLYGAQYAPNTNVDLTLKMWVLEMPYILYNDDTWYSTGYGKEITVGVPTI